MSRRPCATRRYFRLARMYFQKDQPENALQAVERINGAVPARKFVTDLAFLQSQISYGQRPLRRCGPHPERPARAGKAWKASATYNLGIALLRGGKELEAAGSIWTSAGRIESDNPATLAIKDKANLVLGDKLMSEKKFEAAKEVLDRVRLSGPFSNRALLGSGWADASRERFENALVPWSILAEREVTDSAVQEAMLAVPYAYEKLGVYSRRR